MNPGDGLCWWLTGLARDLAVQGLPPMTVDQLDADVLLVEVAPGELVPVARPPGLALHEGDRLSFDRRGLPIVQDASPVSVTPAPVALPAEIDLTVDLASSSGRGPAQRPAPGCGVAVACSSIASSATPNPHRTSP